MILSPGYSFRFWLPPVKPNNGRIWRWRLRRRLPIQGKHKGGRKFCTGLPPANPYILFGGELFGAIIRGKRKTEGRIGDDTIPRNCVGDSAAPGGRKFRCYSSRSNTRNHSPSDSGRAAGIDRTIQHRRWSN